MEQNDARVLLAGGSAIRRETSLSPRCGCSPPPPLRPSLPGGEEGGGEGKKGRWERDREKGGSEKVEMRQRGGGESLQTEGDVLMSQPKGTGLNEVCFKAAYTAAGYYWISELV